MKRILVVGIWAIVLMLFANHLAAQYVYPVRSMDIPAALSHITIDGDVGDHEYGTMQHMQIAKKAGAANPNDLEDGDAVDFNCWFRAAWDLEYLYLYIEVTDDIENSFSEGKTNAWTWDNFEVFIDLDTNSITSIYDSTSTVQLRYCRTYGIESTGRAKKEDYMVEEVNDASMWAVEIAIPWTAAAATGVYPDMWAEYAEGIIGFDLSVADSDYDGLGPVGGRDLEGGAQAFWDQDTPIDNADNAYQNRRVFGLARITGIPCCDTLVYIQPKTPTEKNIKIFPNPARHYLMIDTMNSSDLQGCTVNITNLLGETVWMKAIDQLPDQIDLSAVSSSGLHFIRLYDKSNKLLKVNKIMLLY